MSFPGRTGSVIYLNSYLSTMFQVSDVMVDKDEVAMSLNIKLHIPEDADAAESILDDPKVCVSDQLISVSKSQVEHIVRKVAQVLETQGISCFHCPKSIVKLYPLSGDCTEAVEGGSAQTNILKIGMVIQCGNDHPIYSFELTMTPISTNF